MIKLTGLSKSYGKHKVLHDINLSIHRHEIFGIIGKSGAGKSTLLRCINLLETPDAGQVLIDEEDITRLSVTQLHQARHKIGMIFQQFNLLNSKTVFDNIALPMRIQGMEQQDISTKVKELLHLIELTDKAKHYPSQLSGGQKQRVAIARALSCSPNILLCDEATSALDPETTDSILMLLKKINSTLGITILLITHEMDVIKRICHRLAVMEAGQIVETMPISDVFRHKQSVARSMLYAQLSPELPQCISRRLSPKPNDKPVIRLFFEGQGATLPFISQMSRDLTMDINILMANIDRFDGISCGVLVAELATTPSTFQLFQQQCEQTGLTLEILGYVIDDAV